MTQSDDSRDDPGKGPSDGRAEPDLPFDEEAAWRSIVENYGERAHLGPLAVDPAPLDPPPAPPRVGSVFDRSYVDAHDRPEEPGDEAGHGAGGPHGEHGREDRH